jgi:hypothetical protein
MKEIQRSLLLKLSLSKTITYLYNLKIVFRILFILKQRTKKLIQNPKRTLGKSI